MSYSSRPVIKFSKLVLAVATNWIGIVSSSVLPRLVVMTGIILPLVEAGASVVAVLGGEHEATPVACFFWGGCSSSDESKKSKFVVSPYRFVSFFGLGLLRIWASNVLASCIGWHVFTVFVFVEHLLRRAWILGNIIVLTFVRLLVFGVFLIGVLRGCS